MVSTQAPLLTADSSEHTVHRDPVILGDLRKRKLRGEVLCSKWAEKTENFEVVLGV